MSTVILQAVHRLTVGRKKDHLCLYSVNSPVPFLAQFHSAAPLAHIVLYLFTPDPDLHLNCPSSSATYIHFIF